MISYEIMKQCVCVCMCGVWVLIKNLHVFIMWNEMLHAVMWPQCLGQSFSINLWRDVTIFGNTVITGCRLSFSIRTDKTQYFSMKSEDTLQKKTCGKKNQAGKQVGDVRRLFPIFQTIPVLFMCSWTSPCIFPPWLLTWIHQDVCFLFSLCWNAILKHIIHTGLGFSRIGKNTARRRNPLKIGSGQKRCIKNTQKRKKERKLK